MNRGNVVIFGAEHKAVKRLCQIWSAEGWTVLAAFTSAEAKEIEKLEHDTYAHDKLHTVQVDLPDPDSVKALVQRTATLMEQVDIVVSGCDLCLETRLRDGIVSKDVLSMYDYNALAPLRIIEKLLPFMENGLKRICFFSDVRGSLSTGRGAEFTGYAMSLAAKHMSVKIMSNFLGARGYTFRIMAVSNEHAEGHHEDNVALRASWWFADFTDSSELKVENELGELLNV